MNRKRLLLISGCAAAILLAGYMTLRLTAPRHRITGDTIHAIDKGMTEREVEAILGAPAGDYSAGKRGGLFINKHRVRDGDLTGPEMVKMWGGKYWVSDETSVWVRFNEAGKVEETWPGWVAYNDSFLTKLRRWLGM